MVKLEELDRAFSALADQTRRAMVQRLSEGEASVSELARPFDISMPAVLKHLSVLEAAGLASCRKQGRVKTCSLRPEALDRAVGWIEKRREVWERRLDQLAEHLEEGS